MECSEFLEPVLVMFRLMWDIIMLNPLVMIPLVIYVMIEEFCFMMGHELYCVTLYRKIKTSFIKSASLEVEDE